MVAFRHPAAIRVAESTRIFTLAESLGGVDSGYGGPTIGPGTFISDSTPPSDSASVKIRVTSPRGSSRSPSRSAASSR